MKRGPWKHWVQKLKLGGKWWVFPAISFVVAVISVVLLGMPEVTRIPAVKPVLNLILVVAFFFALVSIIMRIQEKSAQKVRAKYTKKRQMRNYFGGANIYLKTIGWSLFAIFFAVIPFASILIALQEGVWWASLIGLLIYGGILYALGHWGGLWKVWRDVFSGQTTLVGRVRRGWVREFTVGAEGGTHKAYQFRLNVEGQGFKVDEEFLHWLRKDDEVIVHYYPHKTSSKR